MEERLPRLAVLEVFILGHQRMGYASHVLSRQASASAMRVTVPSSMVTVGRTLGPAPPGYHLGGGIRKS